MDYISTRDPQAQPAQFTDILLGGLAADGGLYLPTQYPQLDAETLANLREVSRSSGYAGLAAEVLQLFVDDIPAAELEAMARRAYSTEKFAHEEIVPVTKLDEQFYIGHLSEGPTAAFKDMAMQLLGELFEYELARRETTLNILGATSGDTGSSAEYAMRGRQGIRVFMLTPKGRMSPFQQAQMFGLDDENIFNIALDGVFDDCQDVVKAVSADEAFKREYRIGAVNSINWARLLAQIVYYVSCWIKVTEATGDYAQKVSFSVPTGNFGDICAGHIARQMGLPIDRLIVATNENDVLDEFFRTGQYRPRSAADTHETSSPSMDISRASNFERFIADLLDRDADQVAELFGQRIKDGGFALSDDLLTRAREEFGFVSGRSLHSDRLATIAQVQQNHNIVVDPHTADGIKVAWDAVAEHEITSPVVCLETALPVKFAETIEEALGTTPPMPQRFADIMDGGRKVVDLANDAEKAKDYIRTSIEQTEVR
ncbi:threonine synthase [Corynebacterium pseudodiphtheriticum]|uniref:threonine synthase n=1 Tax=Corynebacterium pseudodiphtheriticum TaxID=37637 RepID=UPI0025427606|nr:threonine synthase [Corynebacterium pseudodiphtheriticum]MDK4278466.1 threonine synthase [Corynebacterium pseudodiphtheriticum]